MGGVYSVRKGKGNEGDDRNKQESFHKKPWKYVNKRELHPKNNDGFYTEK